MQAGDLAAVKYRADALNQLAEEMAEAETKEVSAFLEHNPA